VVISLDFTIRPATKADEPFLWEMLYQAIYVEEGTSPPARDILKQPDIARYVESWGRAGDYGLIAIDESTTRPIGAVWLRLFTVNDAGYGYVAADVPELSMAVFDEYRGRGVGTALLARLLDHAKMTYQSISLSVSPRNPALHLYQRFGFRTVEVGRTSLTLQLFWNDVTSP
jgi:ribosomal protein S18 acetylase RimI-like enzyme